MVVVVEEVKNFGRTLQKIDIHLLYVIIRCICTGGGAAALCADLDQKGTINFRPNITKTFPKKLVLNGIQQFRATCLGHEKFTFLLKIS